VTRPARTISSARATAVVTWVYVAAYGLPAVPVSIYLIENGRLPTLWGLFDMYGGPWASSPVDKSFVALLLAFLASTLVAAWSAWLLWQKRRIGAVIHLAVLPIEAVFWFGFALPIPWVIGAVRVALLASAWRSLSQGIRR
jgi:hypothetical protein